MNHDEENRRLDALETHYQNEYYASQQLRELSRPFWESVAREVCDTVERLFGSDIPADWIIERYDLARMSFWGGPPRTFFEQKNADECFAFLEETIRQYPHGVAAIIPEAVLGRKTPVYKEDGEQGQIWLNWLWEETHSA